MVMTGKTRLAIALMPTLKNVVGLRVIGICWYWLVIEAIHNLTVAIAVANL